MRQGGRPPPKGLEHQAEEQGEGEGAGATVAVVEGEASVRREHR